MSQEYVELGGKKVFLNEPYHPREGMVPQFVDLGRSSTMEVITAAWIGSATTTPLSPLIIGEPGVGKNRLVYKLSELTHRPLYIFQGHEDVTAEDLACAVRFSDDSSRKMDYILSPLVTAMLKGGICFIDEIGKIRPRALALLVSVLDDRRYIDSNLLGERITAADGFRFIAATNTDDLSGNTLLEFIRSRMRPEIHVGFPEEEHTRQIIRNIFSNINYELEPLLDHFWAKWVQSKGRKDNLSPRDAIYLFNLAASHADYESMAMRFSGGQEGTYLDLKVDEHKNLEKRHIDKAFKELFER